jgi:hypothetical protein
VKNKTSARLKWVKLGALLKLKKQEQRNNYKLHKKQEQMKKQRVASCEDFFIGI